MDPERLKQLKELFLTFVELGHADRSAFLDEACRDAPDHRKSLEAIISVDIPTGEFAGSQPRAGAPSTMPKTKAAGTNIGRFRIKEIIAWGVKGVLYEAEDRRLMRTVALKFLAPHALDDEQGKARFLHEARAGAVLDHQNICTVYEIDEAEGQTFIAMAHIDGRSLKEMIASGPLEMNEALDIAIQTAEGLRAAHEKGIVHRDIKPSNIMVTDQGHVRIVDFGLANLSGQAKGARTAVAKDTVAYISPEQVRGEEMDPLTDIWALGVMLHEMLTGWLPFKGDDVQSMIFGILHEAPPALSESCPETPERLDKIKIKALAKCRDDRYESIEEMLVELRLLRKIADAGIKEKEPASTRFLPSIAVFPFANMSANPDQEYFCDGMAEEIINKLLKLDRLKVVARNSAFAFKGKNLDVREIGKKLNVETVLEGSIRKAGNRLRIMAQLINVADGYHIWSDRFDRNMEDILSVQDDITLAIVDELKVKLLPGEKEKLIKPRDVDLEAYHLYLRGCYFWSKLTKEGFQSGLDYFNKAIEKDPDYAPAYAGIAECYFWLGNLLLLNRHEAFQKARETAEKALELDESLAEAHATLAIVKYIYFWETEEAEKGFKKAISINPSYASAHSWYGAYLAMTDRHEEGISEATRGLELDPLSPLVGTRLGFVLLSARQYDRSLEEVQKVREMDPGFSQSYLWLMYNYLVMERYEEALEAGKKWYALQMPDIYPDPGDGALLVPIYAKMRQTEKVKEVLEEQFEAYKREYVLPSHFAINNLLLEQKDKAIEWFEKAYAERDHHLCYTIGHPITDSIRSDPRFQAILKKMGLEPS